MRIKDCSVIEGYRNEDVQNVYFESGLSQLKYPFSKHNEIPTRAVHVVPYPLPDWRHIQAFKEFALFSIGVAHGMGTPLINGGIDWENPKDWIHFELL